MGRNKVDPETHLVKIKHQTCKKKIKLLKNNAASCLYRHKIIKQKQEAEIHLREEEKRQQALLKKSAKLDEDIRRLKMLLANFNEEPKKLLLSKTSRLEEIISRLKQSIKPFKVQL